MDCVTETFAYKTNERGVSPKRNLSDRIIEQRESNGDNVSYSV